MINEIFWGFIGIALLCGGNFEDTFTFLMIIGIFLLWLTIIASVIAACGFGVYYLLF